MAELNNELQDLQDVMKTEQGRRVLYRLVKNSGMYTSSYNPEASDISLAMAFREGARNEGLRLTAELQTASPELFRKMIEENSYVSD